MCIVCDEFCYIVAECPKVSSLNDSSTWSGPSVSIPVNSKVVGNLEPESSANPCTNNSSSSDGAVTDPPAVRCQKTDDEQRSETSVPSVSNTGRAAASVLGERTTDAAQTDAGNEPLEAAADASCSAADGQNVYHVKWIKFHGSQMPIVMQNQNGPCPLLAIVNVLLLQGKIKLSSSADLVASDQLMAYIADWIFDNVPKVCT